MKADHTAHGASLTPRLSIGMPIYNGEAYVSEAIDSLLAQTTGDFELIISDNASTDSTPAICQAYAAQDSRVRYIRQPSNLGASGNFVFVLRAARYEYFMWAACDDVWSPTWTETLLRAFRPGDVGLVSGYQEGNGVVTHPRTYLPGSHVKFFLDSDRTGKCLYFYSIFRREAVLQSDFRLFNCPIGADQVYLLHLVGKGALRCIPGAVLSYRVHNESMSVQLRSTRNTLRTLLSRFPFTYYRMSLQAVPPRLKWAMPVLITWKYLKVQTALFLDLMRAILRRGVAIFRR